MADAAFVQVEELFSRKARVHVGINPTMDVRCIVCRLGSFRQFSPLRKSFVESKKKGKATYCKWKESSFVSTSSFMHLIQRNWCKLYSLHSNCFAQDDRIIS